MRNSPPPWDHHKTLGVAPLQEPRGLGIVLLQGPRGAVFLMSEVALYSGLVTNYMWTTPSTVVLGS